MFPLLLAFIFICPFLSSITSPTKNFNYTFLLITLLLSWILIKKISFQKIPGLKVPLALFTLALILSFSLSINIIKSSGELYKYIPGILLIMIIPSLPEEKRKLILLTILACALLISLMAIFQYFFGFPYLEKYMIKNSINSPFLADTLSQKRVFTPFVTPNLLASYLAMTIPLAFLYKKRLLIIIPLLIALILTRSVVSLASLLLGVILYINFRDKSKNKKQLLILASGITIAIVLTIFLRSLLLQEHLRPSFSLNMRLNYWRDTFEIIKLRPIFGVGLGNFNIIFSRYAHNSYLQFWAEAGIFGISALLWLLYSILKQGFDTLKRNAQSKEALILITCVAIFLFNNLFDFSLFLPEIMILWWTLAGLLLSYGEQKPVIT